MATCHWGCMGRGTAGAGWVGTLAGSLARYISAAGRPPTRKERAVVFLHLPLRCSGMHASILLRLPHTWFLAWLCCAGAVGGSLQEGTVASVCPWKHRSSDESVLASWHLMCSSLRSESVCGGAASTEAFCRDVTSVSF